jgi:transposase
MRYELGDFEWTAIKPMLPNKQRGVRRVNDRRVLNGIFWVLRSGAPWRDLPENYGPYTTCYNRFVRWRRAGIWDQIMEALAAGHDAAVQMIDTSVVRVHQHGARVADNNQPFRRNEIVKIRSASARICIARVIWSNGSSTRSSNVGVSRPDTTNSRQTIWRSSSLHQSEFGCVPMSPRPKSDLVIPGCASWRRPGIHNHDREYGFSDPQLRIIARASRAPE